jgi:hypothetical protein
MKNSLVTIIISIFLFHGCENIDVVQSRIDYKEKIVVSAELVAGSSFSGVTFTRTLPVGEPYDIKKAEIVNVNSYIRINYVKIVPLHYQKNSVYKPAYSFVIEPGDVYELFGNVNEKSFYSKTIIPEKPFINKAVLESDYIQASITPKEGEVYGGKWFVYSAVSGDTIDIANEFFSIIESPDLNSSAGLNVRTSKIPQRYLSSAYLSMICIEVYAIDKAYLNYYSTRSNQNVVSNAFTQGGGEVVWNVFGEDAIGLFIGIGKNSIKATKP